MSNTPTPLDRIRWLPYINTEATDAAPAGACLAIGGVTVDDGQAVLQCAQFAGAGPLAFNGLQQVAAGAPGQCTQDYPALAAYDSSATPATGDTWIPKSGQWSLTLGSAGATNGFVVVGPIDTTAQTMWVVPAGASGAAVVAVIDTPGVAAGTPSSPYGQCVWAGQVVAVNASAPTFCNDVGGDRFTPTPLPYPPDGNCWIIDLDSLSGSGAPNATLMKGEKYIGIPCGSYTVGTSPGVTLPLYAVRKGQQSDVVQINTANPPAGGSGSSTTGQTVQAQSTQLFDCNVQNWTPGTSSVSSSPFTAGVACWLYFTDVPGGSQGAVLPTAVCGDNYVGTLLGNFDPYPGGSGGTSDNRPLYLCRKGSNTDSVVQIDTTNSVYFGSGSASAGKVVKANSSQLFSATLESYNTATSDFSSSPFTAGQSVWLYFVDVPYGGQGTTPPIAVAGDNYIAIPVGSFTVGSGSGATRPLYMCRKGLPAGPAEIIGGTTAASLSSKGTVSCNVAYKRNGASPGSTVNVSDQSGMYGAYPVASGTAYEAMFDRDTGNYYFTIIVC